MFIIDTLFLSPVYATVWAARQVQKAVQQEQAAEPDQITTELSELYMRLETGQITETEFNASEKVLLDRLDRIQGHAAAPLETGPSPVMGEKTAARAAREPKGADESLFNHNHGRHNHGMPGLGQGQKQPLTH